MADKSENDKRAADEVEVATYHVDRLVGESEDFFGQPSHVAAGAFAGEQRKNFSRDEGAQIIKKWLRQEVPTEA